MRLFNTMSGNVSWTSENDEKLIHFVKNHEALYNVRAKEYRQTQMKQNLWNKIGIILQISGSDCSKRWAYVRDYYIRRKGKPGIGSGGEAARNRAVLLSFLDSLPASQRLNTVTNVIEDEVILDESGSMENTEAEIAQIDETDEYMKIINCKEDNNKKMNVRKDNRDSKKTKITHSEERLQLLKQTAERNATPAPNELDETDLFFNAMAKIVKKLPRYEQVKLRMQISTLVGNAELKSILDDSRQTDDESVSERSIHNLHHHGLDVKSPLM